MAKTVQDIARGGATVAQNTVVGDTPGNRRVVRKVITADANYPAGGYAVSAADLGFAFQIDYLEIINDASGPAGGVGNLSWFWNRATQKLQLIVVSTGVENATADVHLSSCEIRAEGL